MKLVIRFGIFFIALVIHSNAIAQRTAYQLIEGKNGTGLWLSAKTLQKNGSIVVPEVDSAIKVNEQITSYNDASQLKQSQVAKSLKAIDLKRTPALIPIDAKSVEYNNIWKWGNDVILDVNYQLPTRTIPWRSDYRCSTAKVCRLLVDPKDQFFELSYYLYKNQNVKGIPEGSMKKVSASDSQFVVNWADPTKLPAFSLGSVADDAVVWHLQVKKIDNELKWSKKAGQFIANNAADKNSMSNKLLTKVNQSLVAAKIELSLAMEASEKPDDYRTPLEKRGFGYFNREINQSGNKQVSKRLAYKEQINNMLSSWSSIKLIGSMDLADRTYVFVQPTIKATGEQKKDSLGAVTVFESTNGNIDFGISADWVGALVSSDTLLESIRRARLESEKVTSS